MNKSDIYQDDITNDSDNSDKTNASDKNYTDHNTQQCNYELLEANRTNIASCYEDFRNIFINYRLIIRPFISILELLDENFPVEILNEIRAIFQHLSRCYYCIDYDNIPIENIKKEISKANGHINRALFDCFKYSCLSLYDEYERFTTAFKDVDLSLLDNGEFLPKLHNLSKDVKLADRKARKLEADVGDNQKVFSLYEDAFNKSCILHDYINKHISYALKLKRKFRITRFFNYLGWIVGFIAGIVTIWQSFGEKIINFFVILFANK